MDGPCSQYGAKDSLHLEHREVQAGTALASATPRHPCSVVGRRVEKPLGSEDLRIGVGPGVMVQQVGAGQQVGGRTVGATADHDRLGNCAGDREEKYTAVAQYLLDRCCQVVLALAVIDLTVETCAYVRVVREQLKSPSQLRRSRLVSCENQRHDVVPDLFLLG